MKYLIYAFITISIALTGCGKKVAPSTLAVDQFFDVVYVATQYRVPGSSTWFPTSGLYEMQFLQDKAAKTVGGTFLMHYTSYLESNLCPYGYNCVCSGGITGLFTDGTTKAQDTSGQPYDPNMPYDSGGGTGSTTPTDSSISKIYSFNFALNIQVVNLTTGCANGHKYNQPVRIYRFSNGDLIVTNDTSQLYMTPEIK
jgi:hypothetical protein